MTPKTRPRALGLLYRPGLGAFAPDAPTLGSLVAAQTFVEALLRYGSYERYELYVHPYELRDAEQAIAELASNHDTRPTRLTPVAELARSGVPPIVAWHDVLGRPREPFYIRRHFAAAAHPISLTHHAISYTDQLYELFLRLLLARPRPGDSIVCTSEAARAALRDLLGRVREALSHWHPDPPCLDRDLRLDLLPLGVDTELFRPRSKSELRRRLGLPLDRLVLVSLGRISAADKADLLPALRILRDLVRQRPERELLWVIGGAARDGEERIVDDYARRLGIARSVRLIGDCSAERHLWLAAADVFLSPADSIQETFGIAPIEAMACGTPQLVSDWDGYRDTVEHGRTGFRVPTYWAPYGDDLDALGPLLEAEGLADHLLLAQSVVVEPAALRRYLEVLLDDPALRSRLGAASRRTAEARFSWPVVIRQYEALWAELSEIASSASGRQPPDRGESDFDRPFYLDAFAGYPSRLLTDDLVVGIGDAGLRLIRGEEELPAYREYAGIYSVPAIEAVLCRLADGDPSAGGETIGGLVRALTAGCQLSEGPARRLVLWLLKYGFVELEERTSLTETERRAGATED